MTHAQTLVIAGMFVMVIVNTIRGGSVAAIFNGIFFAMTVDMLTHG